MYSGLKELGVIWLIAGFLLALHNTTFSDSFLVIQHRKHGLFGLFISFVAVTVFGVAVFIFCLLRSIFTKQP